MPPSASRRPPWLVRGPVVWAAVLGMAELVRPLKRGFHDAVESVQWPLVWLAGAVLLEHELVRRARRGHLGAAESIVLEIAATAASFGLIAAICGWSFGPGHDTLSRPAAAALVALVLLLRPCWLNGLVRQLN